mgnify:CR=1 FL=1
MSRTRSLTLLPLLAATLLALPAPAQPADAPPAKRLEPLPHYPQIARTVGWLLPHGHLMQYPLDDAVSARAWTNYLAMLETVRRHGVYD